MSERRAPIVSTTSRPRSSISLVTVPRRPTTRSSKVEIRLSSVSAISLARPPSVSLIWPALAASVSLSEVELALLAVERPRHRASAFAEDARHFERAQGERIVERLRPRLEPDIDARNQ